MEGNCQLEKGDFHVCWLRIAISKPGDRIEWDKLMNGHKEVTFQIEDIGPQSTEREGRTCWPTKADANSVEESKCENE
jgi:hypothetical protein